MVRAPRYCRSETSTRNRAVKHADTERLHTSVLVAPATEKRRMRKQRKKAAKQIQLQKRQSELAATREAHEELQAERRSTIYLPNAGESGSAQLRSPGRFKLPRHQDTSATLAGAYPFLAEGGLGADGVFVGQDLYSGGSFVYDPWVLYARGMITVPNCTSTATNVMGRPWKAKSSSRRRLATTPHALCTALNEVRKPACMKHPQGRRVVPSTNRTSDQTPTVQASAADHRHGQ